MNSSRKHNNWLTVGGIIKILTTPVACYADDVVKNWHIKLGQKCLSRGSCSNPSSLAHGSCSNPRDCLAIKGKDDLCPSCRGWYDELASSHKNKSLSKWRQNCDTPKWSSDYWEVAKFFMSALGDNKGSVKDARSTDLSSLLNVLEWMEDAAFGTVRRVNRNLVTKLRSEVRNAWAHAPNQEMTDDQLKNTFDIVSRFVLDLDMVFSHQDVKTCIQEIQSLETHGLTTIVEAELNNLLLLRKELSGDVYQMKEEIKCLKQDQNSDRKVIEECEEMLRNLEYFTTDCCKRMMDLQKWKQDLDKLFGNFHVEIESFCNETKKHLNEIQAGVKELQVAMNVRENESFEQKSCIPEKLSTFTGRHLEVDKIISSLLEQSHGIVSIVGGPGFGKSTIAVEVSHQVRKNKGIPVIFSYLSNISTVAEVTRRLCRDVGVIPGEDPESSLVLWLRNLKQKTILVMDNIEQLLEDETKTEFKNLVRMLRKNSGQQLKILTTSRNQFEISDLKVENVEVREMDGVSSVDLLETFCQREQIDNEYLRELAKLCGHVPLALCIVASRIQDTDDPKVLIKWLVEKPMKALQTSESDQHVQNAIAMSFKLLNDEYQKAFVRLGVFNGNFDRSAAEEVLERSELDTQDFLRKLASRSLIQRNGKRYQIHLLVKQFLADCDQLHGERSIAQQLMVKYILKVCQALTEKYYSKDGCNSARQSLAKDAHHVEEMIKLCQSQEANGKPGIVESVENSDIYKCSSRFFYNFIQNVLPPSAVRNFLESCVALAKTRGHLAIEINFQCLLADEEGHKSNWKSYEYMKRMEEIEQTFYKNENVLKEDIAVVSHFNYCYGRYVSNKDESPWCSKSDLFEQAARHLELSRRSREDKAEIGSPSEKADMAITLLQLGRLNKVRAKPERESSPGKYDKYMEDAQECFQRALLLTKEALGYHDLTSTCYKCLGDFFMLWHKNEQAVVFYEEAKNMYQRLQIESKGFVNLLKNYGSSLSYVERYEDSVQQLEEACDIAEKLPETEDNCKLRDTLVHSLKRNRKKRRDFPESSLNWRDRK